MKPVSYQSMPSPVNGGHPNVALDRVLSTSNVMYCEKCGFASTDPTVFKKHMIEHMGTRFYCFYCNNVSFSEAELNAHLKQHTAKYPFKCPHCGQGYMRRLCLVKHIERLHSKCISQGPAKPGTTKNPHIPVSSALPSVPTADPSSFRPAVRVTVPAPSAAAVRLGKDEQRGKTLDTNVSNATNGNAELYSPLNGLIQHNRALTVSLPEEVTIPAGCLVELVEVKTVNGTKELKLRLVSQQENESVIKDTRTTVSQNTALGKPLSSTFNYPNTVKSMSLGMCTVNRKQCETKTVNVERPAVVPVNISKNLQNQVSKEKGGLKRTSQEIINLECHPAKVPKSILNPVREGNNGIKVREPVNHSAAPPTVTSTRVTNRLTSTLHPQNMGPCVSQRAVDERKTLIPELSKSIPPRRAGDIKSIPRDLSVAVKMEPWEVLPKNSTSKVKKEAVCMPQQSLKSASPSFSVPSAAAVQVRPPAISVCKDNVASPSFSVPRISLVKTPALSNRTNSKISAWNQEVRSNERAGEGDVPEPEGFPVISSVFSLSQQPEDAQGCIPPLVMALRGIVMNKSNSSVCTTRDHVRITNSTEQAMEAQAKEAPASGYCAHVSTKDGSFSCNDLSTKQTSESVKVEHDKDIQHHVVTDNHTHIKEEKSSARPTDNNKCSHTPVSKPSTGDESVSKVASHIDASGTADSLQQMAKSEHDISSKFLTVSLKRVQVGVWKKSKKGLKLRISKYKTQVPVGSLTDCAVIYPMPLKVDQLVKRPGPYQPVVVLNHPKPRASVRGARANTLADAGTSEVVPKCQILKMRLSKVVGQKYEVMGCTVGVSP